METKTENEVKTDAKVTIEAEVKRTSTKDIIALLAEKFPACFSIQGAAKPLKVGIFQDLAEKLTEEDAISKTRLRQALRHYTSSWRYLKAVKLGSQRVDIEGNDVAEIDQAQADYANKTLVESQEKFGNKKPKDKAVKKPYKGSKVNESSTNNSNDADKKNKTKFNAVKSSRPAAKIPDKPKVVLKAAEKSAIVVGAKVMVQLGNSPMKATITEVAGKDVAVQLDSGMVVKTQAKNIYTE
jgi:ProP effector